MFWGLIIKEGKKYSKVVEQEFKLTNAALDLSNQSGDVQVLLTAQDVTYLLCTLNRQVPQTLLNKRFATGEEICFALKGKGAVHLTGNLIEDDYDLDEELEDEEDEDEQMELANGGAAKDRESKKAAKAKVAQKIASGQVSSDEDEDDATFNASGLDDSALNGGDADSDDDEEEEDDEDSEDDGGEDDEDEDDDEDEEDDEEDDEDEEEDEDQPKAKQAKLSHDAKSASQNGNAKAKESKEPKEAFKKQQQQQSNENNPAVRKLQDGLIVEDIKVGSGPEAKPGKKVAVYYVGRLKQSNKVFDSTSSGAGFKFALGRGEVIKGWDLGVAGMKVGGKRRLTIPHKLAYGTKGSPPVIPPCSTLVFEVELKKVL
uniref:FK506-binding protein n=1 Tax=Anopheles marajoara TaxID=58244 RepID=A0A2M4BRP4_9DIPT